MLIIFERNSMIRRKATATDWAMSHFDWKAMASILKSLRRKSEELQGGGRGYCMKSFVSVECQ